MSNAKKYAALFEQVGNAKDMNSWEPALPAGSHRVAVVRYGAKESSTDDGTVGLEGEFVILETDNPKVKVGARHSWYWNIGAPKFTGQYAKDRAKKFLETIQESVGSTDPTGPFGVALADDLSEDNESPELLGVVLDVVVTPKFNADGSPVTFKKGGQVHDVAWSAVPDQDASTFTAVRATLEKLAKRKPSAPEAAAGKAAAASTAATATTATTSGGESKMRSLLGKR